jgi:hypothetical protein
MKGTINGLLLSPGRNADEKNASGNWCSHISDCPAKISSVLRVGFLMHIPKQVISLSVASSAEFHGAAEIAG